MTELLHADLTYKLRGIAYRIHNHLHGGHAERVYEEALAIALEAAAVPFRRQPVYCIEYSGKQVGEYRPDFALQDGKVLAELKATPEITALHKAQAISYLAVTGADLALIMNFGGASMAVERVPNFVRERQINAYSPQVLASSEVLFPALSLRVLDALGHVHRVVGPGFLHQVYRRATRIEFTRRQIEHVYIRELPIRYDGHLIQMQPTRLLHVDNKLLVAIVALREITATETERLKWAMNMTQSRLGLIANFHGTRLEPCFIRTP